MLRFVLAVIITCGCAGHPSQVSVTAVQSKCPIDPGTFNPDFLTKREPLPGGKACLGFPLRNADRLSTWFRDERHPFTPGKHTGIDIPVPVGTVVVAPASGRIASVGQDSIGTSVVNLDIGGGWTVSYVHLRIVSVTEGQKVVAGQIVGLSGGQPGDPGAGPCTTGPHLHYALWYRGKLADPLAYTCLK